MSVFEKKRSVRETFLKRVLEEEKRQERIKRLKNEKEDRNESIIFRSGGEKRIGLPSLR